MRFHFILVLFLLFSVPGSSQRLPYLVPFRDGTKWGLADTTKKIVVPCQYDAIFICDTSFFCFNLNGKKGVINDSGRVIIPAEYDDVNFEKQWIMLYADYKYGLADKNGKVILPLNYEHIQLSYYSDSRAYVSLNVHQGLVELPSGKEIIPCAYDWIDDYTRTYFVNIHKNEGRDELKGAYNSRGKLIVPVIYEYLQYGYADYRSGEYDSSLLVANDGKTEFVYDTSGALLFSKKGVSFEARRDSLFIVYDKKGTCVETGKGVILLPSKNEEIEWYDCTTSDYARVYNRKTKKYGITALNGRRVTPAVHDDAWLECSSDNVPRFLVTDKNHQWLIDSTENILFDLGIDSVNEATLFDEYVIYRKNGLVGCSSWSGKEIIPFQYDDLGYDENTNQFVYSVNGKWGLMDSTGAKMFAPKFHFIYPVDGEYAMVNDGTNNKMNPDNLISVDGTLLFTPGEFDSIINNLHMYRDYQVVNYKHGHGVISSDGKMIVKDTFDMIAPAPFGYFAVKNNMFMCLDSTGKRLSHYLNIEYAKNYYYNYPTFLPEQEAGSSISSDLYYVRSRSGYGFVNMNGKEIVPPDYENVFSEYPSRRYNYNDFYGGYDQSRNVAAGDSELFMLRKDGKLDVYLYSGKKLEGISGKSFYLKKLDPRMDLFIFGDKGTAYTAGGLRRFGLMDSTGKIVLQKYYHTIRTCLTDSNLIIANDSAGKIHYYDRRGNETGPPEYDEAYYGAKISCGLVLRAKKGKYGLIDNSGKVIVPFEYESLVEINTGVFLCRKNAQSGLMDETGKILVPISYSWIVSTTKPGLFYTEKGYIDIHGTEYWK
ncbi:MAG TPA: WG repeat-containing protein [Bacteroidia bacterium]|nr:WG repeat-containing protein [Bacteroidia bacterium]